MASSRVEQVHAAIAHLQRLSDLFRRRREQLAASVGLTEHQWGVLEEISTEHFMPSLFAKQRESSAAAVSKTIRQLVDKDLVSVSLDENDARQRRYELTGQGRKVMSQLRRSRKQAIEKVWMDLDQSQLRMFNGFAEQLASRLETLLEPKR
jgi:DNA-binding MarR family transcriptional regulator